MLRLKVINLWCGPGGGKSTTAAGLFNLMKVLGKEVELVTEYAKDVTYEKNFGYLQNQLHILAQQDLRLRRLEGQVEWAVTDSPLPLGMAYMTEEYDGWLPMAVKGAYDRYTNYDFLIRRVKPYVQYGRNQSEPAALAIDAELRQVFKEFAVERSTGHPAREIYGDEHAHLDIYQELFKDDPLAYTRASARDAFARRTSPGGDGQELWGAGAGPRELVRSL